MVMAVAFPRVTRFSQIYQLKVDLGEELYVYRVILYNAGSFIFLNLLDMGLLENIDGART